MDHGFTSKLADRLTAFVDFKRAMGYVYGKSSVTTLRQFDRFCAENKHVSLTREAADGWVKQLVERSAPTSTLSEISAIREFGRYLYSRGDTEAYVLPMRHRSRPRIAMPYLLSEKEIAAFFMALREYQSRQRGHIRKIIYSGIFQTMHACGIRNCEATRLTCEDVDLDKATIDIIDSKGPKSRRLYFSRELADFLSDYDKEIALVFPKRQFFFPSLKGEALKNTFIERGFGHIWDAAGLPRPESGTRPNPYAFRHHFAFANIARWAKEGRDVLAMMPYLARYMGHASIKSTYYYIHLSPDIIADIPVSTESLEGLLPEVTIDD